MQEETKQPTSSPYIKRVLKPTLIAVAVLAVLLQLRYDFYLFSWSAPDHDATTITNLIVAAINGSNQPAAIEPVSKRIYLPDASLVLPPASTIGEVRYNYTPASDGSDAFAQVTLGRAQSVGISKILGANASRSGSIWKYDPSTTAVFKTVPNAQACTRGVGIVFGTKSPGSGTLQFTKQLADGRTMRVFKEAPGCSYNLQPLVDELKQAQSY